MTKIPNCASCVHAVKIAGKRGIQCGHGSSMGNHSISEARRRPRWIELMTFRGLCSSAGVFFEKKPRKAREKREVPPSGPELPGIMEPTQEPGE